MLKLPGRSSNLSLLALVSTLLLGFATPAMAHWGKPLAFVKSYDFLRDIKYDGISKKTSLDLRIGGVRTTHYRYKVGSLETTDCKDAAGYSAEISKNTRLMADISSVADGLMALCLQGVRMSAGNVVAEQNLRRASQYNWYKDAAMALPSHPIAMVKTHSFLADIADGFSDLEKLKLRMIGLNWANRYSYKVGLAADTDCSDAAGYSNKRWIKRKLRADLSSFSDGDELRLCVRGFKKKRRRMIIEQPLADATVYDWTKGDGTVVPPAGPFDILTPTGLINDQTPEITWTASSDAVEYDVVIATDAACTTVVQSFDDVVGTSVSVTTPLASDEYFTCITAFNTLGAGTAASNDGLDFEVDVDPPAPFNILTPSGDQTSTGVSVTWEAAAGADNYDVVIATASDCTGVVNSANVAGTSIAFLVSDGDYFTCVTANDTLGNSTAATNQGLAFSIDTMPPAAFAILGPAGTINDDTPEVTWESSTGAVAYTLEVATDAACTNVVFSQAGLTGTSLEVTPALAAGNYFSCVTAEDDVGLETAASNNGLAFTIDLTPPFTNIAFATSFATGVTSSQVFPPAFPNFGNIEAASWLCTLAAFNGGLITSWNGTDVVYRAVLSHSTSNAVDHVDIQGPVFNTNGDLLANDEVDFFDGTLFTPINYDEFGTLATGGEPDSWTGTVIPGVDGGATCGEWDLSGSSGLVGSHTSASWLLGGTIDCSSDAARLICVSPPIPAGP